MRRNLMFRFRTTVAVNINSDSGSSLMLSVGSVLVQYKYMKTGIAKIQRFKFQFESGLDNNSFPPASLPRGSLQVLD